MLVVIWFILDYIYIYTHSAFILRGIHLQVPFLHMTLFWTHKSALMPTCPTITPKVTKGNQQLHKCMELNLSNHRVSTSQEPHWDASVEVWWCIFCRLLYGYSFTQACFLLLKMLVPKSSQHNLPSWSGKRQQRAVCIYHKGAQSPVPKLKTVYT